MSYCQYFGLKNAVKKTCALARGDGPRFSLSIADLSGKIVVGADDPALLATSHGGQILNAADIFSSVADDIELQLHSHYPHTPAGTPASISLSLAVALLQKSVRRGRADLALAAADVLLRSVPDRLWRRLTIIACEDMGIADFDALYLTVVAAGHRRRLARRFGMGKLVSLVVSKLAAAAKCRATDDLYVVSEDCPGWWEHGLELAEMPFRNLLDVIASDEPIERRAIAMRLTIGTTGVALASRLARRRGQSQALFDFLCEAGFPHTLVEISRAAFGQTGEPICGFLPLLHRELDGKEAELQSDDFPPETMIGEMPGWTFDKFSREGRNALGRFLNADCATANWLRLHVPQRDRMAALGHALFRVESGLVKDRLMWPCGLDLRRQADLCSWPFPSEDAATLLHLMRSDVGDLNHVREAVYGH